MGIPELVYFEIPKRYFLHFESTSSFLLFVWWILYIFCATFCSICHVYSSNKRVVNTMKIHFISVFLISFLAARFFPHLLYAASTPVEMFWFNFPLRSYMVVFSNVLKRYWWRCHYYSPLCTFPHFVCVCVFFGYQGIFHAIRLKNDDCDGAERKRFVPREMCNRKMKTHEVVDSIFYSVRMNENQPHRSERNF